MSERVLGLRSSDGESTASCRLKKTSKMNHSMSHLRNHLRTETAICERIG